MFPAARIGNMHTCPKQDPAPVCPKLHVGGPITGPRSADRADRQHANRPVVQMELSLLMKRMCLNLQST